MTKTQHKIIHQANAHMKIGAGKIEVLPFMLCEDFKVHLANYQKIFYHDFLLSTISRTFRGNGHFHRVQRPKKHWVKWFLGRNSSKCNCAIFKFLIQGPKAVHSGRAHKAMHL